MRARDHGTATMPRRASAMRAEDAFHAQAVEEETRPHGVVNRRVGKQWQPRPDGQPAGRPTFLGGYADIDAGVVERMDPQGGVVLAHGLPRTQGGLPDGVVPIIEGAEQSSAHAETARTGQRAHCGGPDLGMGRLGVPQDANEERPSRVNRELAQGVEPGHTPVLGEIGIGERCPADEITHGVVYRVR